MATPRSVSKCDVLRAGAAVAMRANACAGDAPEVDCYVTDTATKRDMLFRTKYSPAGLLSGSAVRNKELEVLQGDIAANSSRLRSKYGDAAPVNAGWVDFTRCLWNADGSRGGPHGNVFFDRDDLVALGYQPQPLFAVSALKGRLPSSLTRRVPVWFDRIFDPDLAVVFLFLVVAALLVTILFKVHRWSKGKVAREAAAKEFTRRRLEASDPFRGTRFESFPADPDDRWRRLVPAYEAEGYCMEDYRKKLGMPVTSRCSGVDGGSSSVEPGRVGDG
jgi:hypothetical protein